LFFLLGVIWTGRQLRSQQKLGGLLWHFGGAQFFCCPICCLICPAVSSINVVRAPLVATACMTATWDGSQTASSSWRISSLFLISFPLMSVILSLCILLHAHAGWQRHI
jgi:hypothetical protein